MTAVRLRIGERDYAAWTAVRVTRGIERAAGDFSVTASADRPEAVPRVRVVPGDLCAVYLGDDRVITGYVDDVVVRRTGEEASLEVTGRSKTADLVDCSAVHATGRWKGATAARIASDLAAYYEIGVVAAVDVGAPLTRFALELGETVFDAVERLARQRSLLVTDDETGRLVLTRAGASRAATALEHPGNVLELSVRTSAAACYSDYICRGQVSGNDQVNGTAATGAHGTVSDPAVTRQRTLILQAEGQADSQRCRERAAWEAQTRAGRSLAVEVVVAGFHDGAGALWRPNQIVQVASEYAGLDGELLVTECSYTRGSDGARTQLTLAPVEAFALLAPAAVPAGLKSGRAASQRWAELAGGA